MNAPEVVVTQEARELAAKSADALAVSKDFRITSSVEYENAGNHLKVVKGLQKRLDDAHRNLKAPALEQCRRIDTFFKEPRGRAQQAESVLKRAMITFQMEQDRIRREQEAKAREQAEKERQKLEAKAAKLDDKGKTEQAEELRNQAAVIPTPVVTVETPRVSGISTRTTYRAEVTDVDALVAAVAAGKVPKLAILPNDKFLNEQARSYKSALNWPGVKVVEDQGISSRSA
jgi:hypothetical protein